jgi:hypothetical protein
MTLMDVLAISGLAVGAVGAAAAVVAALFSVLAPSRKDLKRVEKNTQETSARVGNVETHIRSVDERLREQHARAMVEAAASRVSITANGEQDSEQFRFIFLLKDPEVKLVSVDLLNEAGTLFGSLPCRAAEPGTFGASADNLIIGKWYNAGWIGASDNARRLGIRAHLLISGQDGYYRNFAVYVTSRLVQVSPGSSTYVLRLEGAC